MKMQHDQFSPVTPLTPVAKTLIISCVVVYFIDFFLTSLGFHVGGMSLAEVFGLVPAAVLHGWVWQFVTYIFMHGHPLHLLLNMLILWYFGSDIEIRLGGREFVKYFALCGIGAGVFNFLVNVLLVADPETLRNPIIGASGAIYGILVAYGIFFGERYFLVLFLFPMKAKYFVMLMAGIELTMGLRASPQDNVAHFAHLGGMLVGALYVWWNARGGSGRGRKRSNFDPERERLKKQFRLIVNEKDDDGSPPEYWN